MHPIKHRLDEELAIRLLGWKWISFVGIPVRETPSYPKKTRVRQLFSKSQLEGKDWEEFARKYEAKEATGEEPLAYSYCSSQGPAMLPKFTILVDGMCV